MTPAKTGASMRKGTPTQDIDMEIGLGPVIEQAFRRRFRAEVSAYIRQVNSPLSSLESSLTFKDELDGLVETIPLPCTVIVVKALPTVMDGFLMMCRSTRFTGVEPVEVAKLAIKAYQEVVSYPGWAMEAI